MINFVNTCFFKPSLLLKSVCILTWELRRSRIILWSKHMKQFLKYNFFQIVRYFWNPFACLLAKYVTGGLFDKRNEGSFFTWGFRLYGYVYPRHCRKRAIVLHCTQHETRLSVSQNDLRTSTWERPEKSLETPPQCLGVIDQKWPLVVLDHFSEKWTWHLSNRISFKTFFYT